MTRRRLTLEVDGNIVVVRGWKASGVLRSAGLRPTFSGTAGGWMVDVSKLPELVAWLDYHNLAYGLEGGEQQVTTPAIQTKLDPQPWSLW